MAAAISIITPWLNCPELIQTYEPTVRGAQPIIVDNGSREDVARELIKMVERLNGKYIRNETNMLFAHANNQGLVVADGEIIMFLNNDVDAPEGWLTNVPFIPRNTLCGPSMMVRYVDEIEIPYIEGWCIAAHIEVWNKLCGWNDRDYQGLYWEDNDLCFRALQLGIELKETDWAIWHFNNFTSRNLPGAYNHSARNQAIFEGKVRATL